MSAQTRSDLSSSSFLETAEFDYVIVGGGTSGLVVAARLTEDPDAKVLVIEAGKDKRKDFLVQCPAMMTQMYGDPEYDWDFMSKTQDVLNGRKFTHPAGKMLGGSSACNIFMMIYPSASGYDSWERLGNTNWNWKTMNPYIRKFHTWTPPTDDIKEKLKLDYIRPELHGTDGPIKTGYHGDGYTVFHEAWPRTFENLQHKITSDPISGSGNGAYAITGTIDPATGRRSHAGDAYYNAEVASRPNLHVLTEALVRKIVFETETTGGLRAVGVDATPKDGPKRRVVANSEVILAAGAINSPKLLELSGVGNATLLESLGIDVKIDNPNVGENLQDHGFVPYSWEVADGQISADIIREPGVAEQLISLWQNNNGAGPLGMQTFASAYMPAIGLEDGTLEKLLAEYPPEDDGYRDFPGKKQQYELLRKMLRSPDNASAQITFAPIQANPENGPSTKAIFEPTNPGMYVSAVPVLNHPFSRGSTHIVSSDPAAKPELSSAMLEHPLDVQLHARHTQWMENIAQTEPMKSLLKPGGRRLPPRGPGDGTLATAIKHTTERIVPHYHLCGTLPMMSQDLGGVLDPELNVYGTTGLRVVDASVFPLIPRGNIQSSVYAVAERAADIIKDSRLAARAEKLRV